ncbi:hypothetical protein [Frankia sp. AvcI1]|uniref:hypothetical protein n=1 Tax=Frankia sp. AvcI1 TaxID=573496 RepID=UPI00138ED4DC|nr:hypothetical protein [Frankia sp. AvcI1]
MALVAAIVLVEIVLAVVPAAVPLPVVLPSAVPVPVPGDGARAAEYGSPGHPSSDDGVPEVVPDGAPASDPASDRAPDGDGVNPGVAAAVGVAAESAARVEASTRFRGFDDEPPKIPTTMATATKAPSTPSPIRAPRPARNATCCRRPAIRAPPEDTGS